MAIKAGRVGVDKLNVDPKTGNVKVDTDIPIATPSTLGGVKPVAKTGGMSQDVGVDSNGKLYTSPGESYTLPVATSSSLGGVKPTAKTEAMTQDVGVDSEGKLYTAPGSSGGGKIYYKDFPVTVSSGSFYTGDVAISNYEIIGFRTLDRYSGYVTAAYMVTNDSTDFSFDGQTKIKGSIGNTSADNIKVRVYYVPKANTEQLT